MKKTWLEIYALAVCFFTVASFVIVLSIVIWNIIALSSPEFALGSHHWERHQTDEAFKESLINQHRWGQERDTYVPPEGAELAEMRERSYAQALRAQTRDALQELVRNLIFLFVGAAVFFVHWKIAARVRQSIG